MDNLPRVLDPRIYRAGFLPILFALVLVGFSLREPPRPLTTSLAPDAFDGATAFRELDRLATAAPLRRPGSAGDRLVARSVQDTLQRNGFRVGVRRFSAETVDGERQLETVIGERAGFSNRRIVVLAHRDALGRGARAELSGTAALLELARVLGGRTLNRTLVLVSTSGGTAGLAAAERLAQEMDGSGAGRAAVDAVLVLGDMAGTRTDRPLVVPWSRSTALAPLALRRTVESALMTEARVRAGTIRPGVQLARLAFPLTLGEQGPFNAHGLGAVLLSASGEHAPAADAPVSESRLTAFGRTALRSIGALDGGGDVAASRPYVVLEHKLLPIWPVRLLAIALLLPVLLAAVDGFARVRRRRERVGSWLGWLAVGALPFVLSALLAVGLFRVGLIEAAPESPVAGLAAAPNGAALASVALLWLLAWFALRPLLLRLLRRTDGADAAAGGAATAILLALCAATVVVWIGNPYASLLLIPALHLWLLAMAPETHVRRPVRLALWALGLLPPLLVAYAYARQFGLDPLELAWMGELLVAGGAVSLLAVLVWCVVLGCSAGALVVVLRASGGGSAAAAPITVRGPKSYAGPGSLGGTESALRR
ncbi:MAG TPA: M28 family peptidase [Conexibacter sp.]|nr:M28 family peptidase [Conexibacter sp.]